MARCDLLGPVGAFGKMPSRGDFVWLDVPSGFASAWDGWLSGVFPHARAALGDRWQACYYSAPIWRFTLAAGLAGRDARAGVLMPSVDAVGRAFPLTLAAAVPADAATAEGHLACTALFEALEAVALDALEDTMTPQRLRQRLDALPRRWAADAAAAYRAPRPAAFADPAARAFWSAQVGTDRACLATRGLPNGRELAAMFDPSDPVWSAEAAE